MTYSEALNRAVKKYRADNFDEIKLYVPKGQKDFLKNKAESLGLSRNEFINQAINYVLENDIIKPKEKG